MPRRASSSPTSKTTARWGFRPATSSTAIDGRMVDSPGDIRRILRSYEDGESVTFQIMRDHAAREVLGTIE